MLRAESNLAAIQDFFEVIRLDPQNANAYSARGLAYEYLGQQGLPGPYQELADRDFAKAKELGYDP